MKLTPIFADNNTAEGLYSVIYQGKKDEYFKIFENWDDTQYVDNYIHNNSEYLKADFFKSITRDQIISKVHDESYRLQKLLEKFSIGNNGKYGEDLKDIFKPLENFSTVFYPRFVKLKAYTKPPKGILRVYGLKLDENVFVVTGGAIKLTKAMKDHPDTCNELKKLDTVRKFLNDKQLSCEDDYLNLFINEP